MPKAIRATNENLHYILNYGKYLKFDLSYIAEEIDNPDYQNYPELQDVYVITDGTKENDNVTFTVLRGVDFLNLWKWSTDTKQNDKYFRYIERV